MNLQDQFSQLERELSERHPALEPFSPLYILALLVFEYPFDDQGYLWPHPVHSALIRPGVFWEIQRLNQVQISSLSKEDFNSICKLYLERCLAIANSPRSIGRAHEKRTVLFNAFLAGERDAVHDTLDIPEVATSSDLVARIKSALERNTSRITFGSRTFEVDLDRVSDEGFVQFALIWILEAFNFDRQNLNLTAHQLNLIASFSGIKPKDKVFVPSCGIGTVFIDLQRRFPLYNLDFRGAVGNPFITLLLQANLYSSGLEVLVEFGDPLGIQLIEDAGLSSPIFDCAIGVLPLRDQQDVSGLSQDIFSMKHPRDNSEYAYIELMLAAIKEEGRIVALVSEQFLGSPGGRKWRREFTKLGGLANVYSLKRDPSIPDSIRTSIIVFDRNPEKSGHVIFDGDDDGFEQTEVSFEEIAAADYDWRPRRYALKASKELDSILANSVYSVRRLGEMVELSVSGKHIPPSRRNTSPEVHALPYVRVSDLLDFDRGFDFNIAQLKQSVPINLTSKVIDFSAILVSRIGAKLKPTYFRYAGMPIAIGSDIIALKLDTYVKPEYILAQLHSRAVQIQVEILSSGNVIDRLRKDALLNLHVFDAPPKEQDRIIFETFGTIEEKVAALDLAAEAKEEAQAAEYDVIAAISHNLNQKLGSVVDDYDSIVRFLRRKARESSTINFHEAIRPLRSGESSDSVESFEKLIGRLDGNLKDTIETLRTTERILQKQRADLEPTEIVEYFKKEIKETFESDDLPITVQSSIRRLIVPLDRGAFKDVVRNLIENAKKHGFTESERKYRINFTLTLFKNSAGEEYLRVLYRNNGNPFPKGFTFDEFKRLAARAGKTKGTGIGGFFVARVIALHKGAFNAISTNSETGEEYPVQFEILLPLSA